MAYDDLREFIRALEKNKELKRIPFEVDPRLEITEFADRSVKNGGPALLFEHPKGSKVPLLINAFASMRRMEIALKVDSVDEVAKKISEYLEMRMPEGLLGKLKMLPKLAEMGAFFPKIVSKGDCQEVVKHEGFSLADYPVLTCWPDDGGPFITLPMVFTRNPETGKRNCGMYRMQVYDERTTGMHWQTHKQGAEHHRRRVAAGETRMDVSVAIGSDPATMYSAILPLPPDLDEMMIAGFLRGSPVEMVKCQTNDLEVPANAEIVLEGYVDLRETRLEGPFGDHTGYYSLADQYPVFHVECVTQRKEPIYATTIVGPPPMEDFYMGKAIERIFLPLMRMQLPEVRDMCMPAEGIFHNIMLVSIRKSYPGHARKVMSAIWGLGQAMFTKCIVVVDEDVDVQNVSEVAWRALNNIDPERDIQFTMGPIDSLDHASRLVNYGSKMGVDATRKWPGEGFTREWPEVLRMTPDVKKRVDELWGKSRFIAALALLAFTVICWGEDVHPITHRRIAQVMGVGGSDWLVRPEREAEEHPDQALDALKIPAGATVADIGTGVGYFAWRLASRVGPGGVVYGEDIQQGMLDQLDRNMRERHIGNVRAVLGTIEDPKLPKNAVDLVLLVDVYHEFSEPEKMLDRIRESLKPGGRLVLLEYRGEDPKVPIKPEHKMTVKQVRAEVEPEGYRFEESIEVLPEQHIIVFRK